MRTVQRLGLSVVGAVAVGAGLVGVAVVVHPIRHAVDASWAEVYPSYGQMTRHADAVVQGQVLESLGAHKGPQDPSTIYTDFSFRVDKLVAGTKTAPIITLHQMGGSMGFEQEDVKDDPLLVPGERDLLFLKNYAPGRFYVMGGPTGRLLVKGSTLTPLPGGALPTRPGESLATVERTVAGIAVAQAKTPTS